MDLYLYLSTLYYLISIYLRRIGAYYIFYCIFLIHITNTPIKFLALLHAMCQHACHLWTLYKGLHTWGLKISSWEQQGEEKGREGEGGGKEKRKGGKERRKERRKEKKKGEEERKNKEEEEGVSCSEQTRTEKNLELRYKR